MVLFNEVLQHGFDGQNFMSGLSSHLRDLLVCQDSATLQLLEVSEAFKARYRQQATACQPEFLFRALEICNQCELSYKASRNPRLHVELALIRLCGIGGEKKNLKPEGEIPEIPEIRKQTGVRRPENKTATPPTEQINGNRNEEQDFKDPSRISIRKALATPAGNPVPVPGDNIVQDVPPAEKKLKPLSEEFLAKCWIAYADQIRESRPRMAVTLKNVRPAIAGNCVIRIELNNRDQLEDFITHTRNDLESFLRREMQNDLISVDPQLVETAGTDHRLYTSEEKFRYLSQKNPLLSKLRQDLNLELD